jgi:NTE family protein
MKISRLLRRQFGETRVEDMWRSLYCVTANLTSGEIGSLRRGVAWRALRATVAVPGLLPPIVEQGDLLADGGIINNFPVDVAYAARRGPIIGVDVGNYRPFDKPPEDFDEKSLFWLWRNRHKNIPGIVSLLMRVGTINGDKRAREARRHLEFLIEPAMPEIELREWTAFDKVVSAGYEQTVRILEKADLSALTARP